MDFAVVTNLKAHICFVLLRKQQDLVSIKLD